MAANQFEQGEIDEAARLLDLAQEGAGAGLHTAEAAERRSEALQAAGESPDAARLMAALTAGSVEYDEAHEVGQSLLEQGEFFEKNGEFDMARTVYEGVFDMGGKIAGNASFSSERLAGLDLQRAAIEMLEPLYRAMGFEEGLQDLGASLHRIAEDFESMALFFQEFSETMWSASSERVENWLAALILEEGDLQVPVAYREAVPR